MVSNTEEGSSSMRSAVSPHPLQAKLLDVLLFVLSLAQRGLAEGTMKG